jgi:hypothetical protein
VLLVLVVLPFIPASILKSVNSFTVFETLLPVTSILKALVSQDSLTIKIVLSKRTLINCAIEKLENSLAMFHPQPKLSFIKPLLFDNLLAFALREILMKISVITFNLTSNSSINKELHFLGTYPS